MMMRWWKNRAKNHKGYSLVELICTIAIFSIVIMGVGTAMVVSARNYQNGSVELELQQRNIIVLDATVSSAFQCGIAARASGIGADEIARLPLRHYLKIKNAARDFLVAVGY